MAKERIENEEMMDEEFFEENTQDQEETIKVEVIPNKKNPISWFKGLKKWQKVLVVGAGAVVIVGAGGLIIKVVKGGNDTVELSDADKVLVEAVKDSVDPETLADMAEEAGLEVTTF